MAIFSGCSSGSQGCFSGVKNFREILGAFQGFLGITRTIQSFGGRSVLGAFQGPLGTSEPFKGISGRFKAFYGDPEIFY